MDLLDLREHREYPSLTDDRGFTYYFVKNSNSQWLVKKIGSEYNATIYTLNRVRNRWTCDCPAGERGRDCKHKLWVGTIANASIR